MHGARAVDLVGRDEELDELERLVRRTRVVTVTGPPGIGKSMLAAALAAREGGRRRSTGAVLAHLEGAQTADAVCRELARVLRLPLSPNATPGTVAAQVGRALDLRGKLLVVLDDADAARDVVAKLLPAWLRDAPQARVVVTSRSRLGVATEARLDLGPLAVPPANETDLAAIAKSDAVRLFVRRAAALRPGYQLARGAARSVAAIVRRVEGVPLAVELCAARITVLSEREIEDLLAAHVGLLSSPSARRSLAAAIAWSWQQLAPEDARVLASCSVFRASFSLDAASEVTAGGRTERHRMATIDALGRLEEASLVRVLPSGTEAAPRRYAVPESIRGFAYDALVARGEAREVEARHARYYGALAARSPALGIDALAYERENLEGAFTTAVANGDHTLAARALVALRPLVLARGPLAPYLARIDDLLASGRLHVPDLAELHLTRGLARVFRGQRDIALDDLAQARKLARRAKLRAVQVRATSKSGLVLGLKGKVREALALLDEALCAADETDDPLLRGIVRKDLANVLSEQGRNEEAIVRLAEARDLFHAAGDTREEGFVLMMLASRLFDEGRLPDASRDLGAALELLARVGDVRTETWTRGLVALVALEAGDLAGARSTLEQALALVRLVGDEHTEGLLAMFLGHVALEQGIPTEAEASYRDARRLLAKAGDRGGEALATAATAFTEAELGRFAAARASLARAQRLLEGDARPARAETVELLGHGVRLREALGGKNPYVGAATVAIQRALERGGSRTPPEEVRFARRLLRRLVATAGDDRVAPSLVVARDGSWVTLPGTGEKVSLGRSRALRLVVQRLATERLRYPGRVVSAQSLVTAGWPGERILPAAAKNRLHVTVARLRRLGLEGLLLRDDDGYLLDPSTPARFADGDGRSVADDQPPPR